MKLGLLSVANHMKDWIQYEVLEEFGSFFIMIIKQHVSCSNIISVIYDILDIFLL